MFFGCERGERVTRVRERGKQAERGELEPGRRAILELQENRRRKFRGQRGLADALLAMNEQARR